MHNLVITRRPVKNGHQNFMCYNEIELHAQNIDTNLGSVVNIIGRAYVKEKENLHFDLLQYLHLMKLQFWKVPKSLWVTIAYWMEWFPIWSKGQ